MAVAGAGLRREVTIVGPGALVPARAGAAMLGEDGRLLDDGMLVHLMRGIRVASVIGTLALDASRPIGRSNRHVGQLPHLESVYGTEGSRHHRRRRPEKNGV